MTHTIHQFQIGPMDNLVYLIQDVATNQAAVVDPGWDADFIVSKVDELGLQLTSVLLTHGHYDHLNALEALLAKQDLPVYICANEADQLMPNVPQLNKVTESDLIEIGDTKISVIETPGHSPGGVCYLLGQDLITGDTLFVDGCGRADLPGSDPVLLYQSLSKLRSLSDALQVYPGHDYGFQRTDTLGSQKQRNRFLSEESETFFLRKRMS